MKAAIFSNHSPRVGFGVDRKMAVSRSQVMVVAASRNHHHLQKPAFPAGFLFLAIVRSFQRRGPVRGQRAFRPSRFPFQATGRLACRGRCSGQPAPFSPLVAIGPPNRPEIVRGHSAQTMLPLVYHSAWRSGAPRLRRVGCYRWARASAGC